MGAPEKRFHKRFEMLGAVFENRPNVVSEEIPAASGGTARRARTICGCREDKSFIGTGVAIEFRFDPQHVVEVHCYAASPTVERNCMGTSTLA